MPTTYLLQPTTKMPYYVKNLCIFQIYSTIKVVVCSKYAFTILKQPKNQKIVEKSPKKYG